MEPLADLKAPLTAIPTLNPSASLLHTSTQALLLVWHSYFVYLSDPFKLVLSYSQGVTKEIAAPTAVQIQARSKEDGEPPAGSKKDHWSAPSALLKNARCEATDAWSMEACRSVPPIASLVPPTLPPPMGALVPTPLPPPIGALVPMLLPPLFGALVPPPPMGALVSTPLLPPFGALVPPPPMKALLPPMGVAAPPMWQPQMGAPAPPILPPQMAAPAPPMLPPQMATPVPPPPPRARRLARRSLPSRYLLRGVEEDHGLRCRALLNMKHKF